MPKSEIRFALIAVSIVLSGIWMLVRLSAPTCQERIESSRGWCVRECATTTMKPLTQCRAECADMYWCKEGEQ